MAIEVRHWIPVVMFVCGFLFQSYFVTSQTISTTTTPWPQLGTRRRVQPSTAPPLLRRDYVAPQRPTAAPATPPSAWNKPLVQPDNVRLSYPNTNLNNPPPRRDYVNPNIPLSYSNGYVNPNNPNNNQALPTTKPTSPMPPPRRDYVNPIHNPTPTTTSNNNNAKPSYSNILLAGANDKNPVKPSTAPSSSVPGTPDTNVNNNNLNDNNKDTNNAPVSDRTAEDNELRDFSEALSRKDTANNAYKYITINYQGATRSSSLRDEAPAPLLSIDAAAYKLPSVEKLLALHNNYIVQSNENEVYTAQERVEENNFLDTVLPTSVLQHTRNFLISKGKIGKDPKEFKDLLRTIWFNMYSRGGGKIGSSGFEHVFLSEIKNDAVSGLHNWLYFNEEEQKKTANYLGFMKKLEFDKGAILKYHFNFYEKDKPVGSMFIGTSPEFELALYTTCFLVRPDDVCPLRLGGKNFIVRTYTYRYRGKNMIGSAFPDI